MPVPETAMNEDGFAPRRERDVRCSGQAANMQAITIAGGMKHAPHGPLGPGISTFDGLHDSAPLFFRSRIGHLGARNLLSSRQLEFVVLRERVDLDMKGFRANNRHFPATDGLQLDQPERLKLGKGAEQIRLGTLTQPG